MLGNQERGAAMSIEALNWAFNFEAKTTSEKAVLLALANYAGGDGRCHPGQESIAKKASCTDRTVRTVLADLEERGIISRERRERQDGSRTSDAIILLAFANQPENSSGSEKGNRKITSSQPENSSGLTTFEPPVEPSVAAAREKSDLESLTDQLIEAAGGKIQPHGAIVLAPILGLIDAGCDLETDILPTIRARTARMARPAGSWGYFVQPIREAYETRIAAGQGLSAPKATVKPDIERSREEMREVWSKRLGYARPREEWISWLWGPPPGRPGCRVPRDILTDRDCKLEWFDKKQEQAA